MVTTRSSSSAKANGTPRSNGKANGTSVKLDGNTNGTLSKKRTGGETLSTPTKRPKLEEKTDPTRWRMLDEKGRHTWHYLEDEEAVEGWPQSCADKWYLGLDTVRTLANDPSACEDLDHFANYCVRYRSFPLYRNPRNLLTLLSMA